MSAIVTWTRQHRLAAFFGLTFARVLVGRGRSTCSAGPRRRSSPAGRWSPRSSSSASPRARPGYRDAGRPAGPLAGRLGLVGGRDRHAARGAGAGRAPRTSTIWGAPAPVLAQLAWASIALIAAIRFVNPLDGPLGEEPGWRGYALPELQAGRSPLAARPVSAALVALWHLPLVTVGELAAVRPRRSRSRSPSSTSGCSTAPAAACCSPSCSTSRRARSATAALGLRRGRRGPDGLARRRAVGRASPSRWSLFDRQAWRAAPRSAVAAPAAGDTRR